MAGSSQKKIEQEKIIKVKYYRMVIFITNIMYLIIKLFSGVLFETSTLLQFAFFSLISYFTYGRIYFNLDAGLTSDSFEYTIDLFVLNTFVQTTTCFYSFFWYFYLIVPGYAMWWVFSNCLGGSSSTPSEKEGEQLDSKAQKKLEKKEKKKEQKIVYQKAKK